MHIEKLLDLDKNEQILRRVKKHPIGLVGIIATGVIGVVVLLWLLYVTIQSGGDVFPIELSNAAYGVIFGVLIVILIAVTYVGVYVYWKNEIVVTNENIIQVLQYSLLSKQISQLNLAKIQDVSVDQNGFLSHIFDYGVIEVETAGEASNFRFPLARNPNEVSKIIIEAHEDYVRSASDSSMNL